MNTYAQDSTDEVERIRKRRERDSWWAGVILGIQLGFCFALICAALILVLGYVNGLVKFKNLDDLFQRMGHGLTERQVELALETQGRNDTR